jgi:PDZ domain-containing protein
MVFRGEKSLKNYAGSVDIAKDSACKMITRIWSWLDLIGMGLALLFIVFGELVWIPDPLRVGHHVYWIELMNELIYVIILPFLLWSIAAIFNIIMIWKIKQANNKWRAIHIMLGVTRIVGLVSSILAIYILIFAQNQLYWLIVFIVLAWLMSLFAIHFLESMAVRSWPRISNIILITTVVLIASLLYPTNYTVTYPGLTMNMNEYAHVDNGRSNGQIEGVLIFDRPAFPIDWVYARLFRQYQFAKRIPTNQSLGEQLQEVRAQQIDANQLASAVAFAKLGLGHGIVSHGARIIALTKGFPASKQMKLGDVIIQINGNPISTTTQLINNIKEIMPGNELSFIVIRDKAQLNLTIKTQADLKDPKKAVIGIQISDELDLDLPLKVEFKPYLLHVGGPSHGAMLTLALIDQLTPGGVTHGNIVAGTGTIDSLGEVGPIGGIRQKAFTIERSKADVFFVPTEQLTDARQGAAHLNIIPVKTIDDILNWLKEHPKS